jgi:hypothetical protein
MGIQPAHQSLITDQVPPSPLHDQHLSNFTLARVENVSIVLARA